MKRRWRVQWHSGGCFGSKDFDTEEAARAYVKHLEQTLGDAESWREGVCGAALSEYWDDERP